MWWYLLLVPVSSRSGCTVSKLQCYADQLQPDGNYILGPPVTKSGAMSQEFCAQVCANRSLPLAGVEGQIECMCGKALAEPALKVSADQCGNPCIGNATESCGGFSRIGVYTYNCSGAPIHPPSPPPGPPPPAACAHFNEYGCSELYNPCLNRTAPYHTLPFCDSTLGVDARVKDALSRMTTQEKIGMLGTNSPPIAALGLPSYGWWSEATSGTSSANKRTQTTKFAYPITTGMSFNRTLWKATGAHIGAEARALMNAGEGFSTFWAPVINLAREPRWGRNIETPGEDPYHSGEYAVAFVHGMQYSSDGHLLSSACCKHYVANEMDGTAERDGEVEDRQHVDSNVTLQDLLDSYMPPFQACVERGKVSGLMCSYNSVNGVPSCANKWLLADVARGEWGLDGYVTADCDADADVVYSHHYRNDTAAEGVRDVLNAGTDVDCGNFVSANVQAALDQGLVTWADVDARLANLWRVRMRLGHFDPVGPLQRDYTIRKDVCSKEGVALSMEGLIQSAALLKNIDQTLPLVAAHHSDGEHSPSGKRGDYNADAAGGLATPGSVVVVGPNANYSWGDTGYYGPGNVCGHKFWTVADAIKRYVPHVSMVPGIPSAMSNDGSKIPDAVAAAAAADTVVMVLGTDLKGAAESHDAVNITFTEQQAALIAQVTAVAKNKVVAVLMTATPLDISTLLLENPKVGAVLHVGQPSVTILGLGDVLFGARVPAGRTVQTFYPAEYQNQISIFDFNMRPGPSLFARPDCTNMKNPAACVRGDNPGRTHRFYNGDAVVPFGFGLSYTTFRYSAGAVGAALQMVRPGGGISVVRLDSVRKLLADTKAAGRSFVDPGLAKEAAPLVGFVVNVTNTGRVDADDVVLGFVTPPGAGANGVPLQTLFGFERVHVKVGETRRVVLYPSAVDFTRVTSDGQREVVSGGYTATFGVKGTAALGMGYAEVVVRAV